MAPVTAAEWKKSFPDIPFIKLPSATEHPNFNYPGFHPSKTILKAGHIKAPGRRAFDSDVIFDRDVAVPMRDGVQLFTDVFRPTNSDVEKIPALIPWSPYGKTGSGKSQYESMGPFNCGVDLKRVSGYQKFEAPDPAEWCSRGYAIINIDARGAGMSQGNISAWGIQEAEDIYDTIDWISKQSWCSGSVGMMGNSWLAISQINFASRLSHPALKALAPMEAQSDPYRQSIGRGGKAHNKKFRRFLGSGFAGPNSAENMGAALQQRPLFDDYWASKVIETENIDVPLYLTASYSSGIHTQGSFHTFRTAKTQQKWLRVHPYQEWFDLYRPEINDELQRYFDRFCKGVDNGWERDFPPLRLSLLGFNGSPAATIVERPETEYPLARQKLQKFFLDNSTRSLLKSAPKEVTSISHEGHSLEASSDFVLRFENYTELAGYAKVRLWMSCKEKDDMDVGVQIRKIDASGKLLEHLNYECPVPIEQVPNVNVAKTLGPQGFLRASHAISRVDESQDGQEIFYRHDRREPILPLGTIVPLDITFWPMGMVFAEGEGIMLRISGHDKNHPEVEEARLEEPEDENIGNHTIWTGGKYDSHLILPFISAANEA